MNFKIFATVFVGLLAINISVQSPVINESDLLTFIAGILNTLVNTGNTFIKDVDAFLLQFEQDPSPVKEELVNFGKKLGGVLISIILQVEQFRDSSTDEGKIIIDCIVAEKGTMEADVARVSETAATCQVDQISELVNATRALLSDLLVVGDGIQNQVDSLSTCSQSDLNCIETFLTSTVQTIEKSSADLNRDLEDLTEVLQVVSSEAIECATKVSNDRAINRQGLFDDAVECIYK